MAKRSIKSKDYKIGFSNFQKKSGVNFWRFFFPGINEQNKDECFFCLEFEALNPNLSENKVLFSLLQKKIKPEDMKDMIDKKKKKYNYTTVPASGLYLKEIDY